MPLTLARSEPGSEGELEGGELEVRELKVTACEQSTCLQISLELLSRSAGFQPPWDFLGSEKPKFHWSLRLCCLLISGKEDM